MEEFERNPHSHVLCSPTSKTSWSRIRGFFLIISASVGIYILIIDLSFNEYGVRLDFMVPQLYKSIFPTGKLNM